MTKIIAEAILEENMKPAGIDYPDFTEYEIARDFGKFQVDIENYKKVIKKLKRKKIEFDLEFFTICIKHLEANEEKYFNMMQEMFSTEDELEKAYLIEELSFMIYNRFGIQRGMYDYEMKVTDEHKNK